MSERGGPAGSGIEVEFTDTRSADMADDVVSSDDLVPPPDDHLALSRPAAFAAAVVLLCAGGLAAWLLFSDSSSSPDDPPASPVAGSTRPQPSVDLRDGAGRLEGVVALAPVPIPGPSGGIDSVWVVGNGRVASRTDVSIAPRDHRFPLVHTENRVFFTSGDRTYFVDETLATTERSMGDGGFLLPGGRPGLVWNIVELGPDGDGLGIAQVTVTPETVTSRPPIDVTDDVATPLIGVADGLLVEPVDTTVHGSLAYWTPAGGLEGTDVDPGDAQLLTARLEEAYFLSPAGRLLVVDVPGSSVSRALVLPVGSDDNTACVSPDGSMLAVSTADDEAVVFAVASGDEVDRFPVAQPANGLAWTSPTQIVSVSGAPDQRVLVARDISTQSTATVARLNGLRSWWIVTDAGPC